MEKIIHGAFQVDLTQPLEESEFGWNCPRHLIAEFVPTKVGYGEVILTVFATNCAPITNVGFFQPICIKRPILIVG